MTARIEGFEPTTLTAEPEPPDQSAHFAPSDYDRLAEALPHLEGIGGISSEWMAWYEGLTVRMGIATGATQVESGPEVEEGHA